MPSPISAIPPGAIDIHRTDELAKWSQPTRAYMVIEDAARLLFSAERAERGAALHRLFECLNQRLYAIDPDHAGGLGCRPRGQYPCSEVAP